MRMMVLAAALLVCACGQATNHASAQGAGGAGASGAAETQEQFVARCTRETIAQNPQAQSWAQGNCEQIWEKVAAAGPLAEMILAAAPATAAPAGLSATCAQLAMVRWSGGASGATLATGKLGADLDIAVQRAPPSLAISWSGGGDIVTTSSRPCVGEAQRLRWLRANHLAQETTSSSTTCQRRHMRRLACRSTPTMRRWRARTRRSM
jgi:hypothetical protein